MSKPTNEGPTRVQRRYRLFLDHSPFLGYGWSIKAVVTRYGRDMTDRPLSVGPSGATPGQCRRDIEAMLEAFDFPACVEIDPAGVEWLPEALEPEDMT